MKTSADLYQVVSYNPEAYTCNLAPATQNARGILRDVPIGCFWGGSWEIQRRYSPPFPNLAPQGARWGIGFPVQAGDYCIVSHLDQTTAYISSFLPGWRGARGPAYVGQQSGEPIQDRFDVLHPSGAWLRCLRNGTWIVNTPENSARVTISADGTVTLDAGIVNVNAGEINLNGDVHVNGSQDINGKKVMVIGGLDSAGDQMVQDGQ